MSNYSEAEIKNIFPSSVIDSLKKENVEFSGRITEGTADKGYTEFLASVETLDEDGDDVTVSMFLLIDSELVNSVDSLDLIDWAPAIKEARYDFS